MKLLPNLTTKEKVVIAEAAIGFLFAMMIVLIVCAISIAVFS